MSDIYQIQLKEHVDVDWSEWFENLTITHTDDGTTNLSGSLTDQSALYGLLCKIHSVGLSLISVNRSEETNLFPSVRRVIMSELQRKTAIVTGGSRGFGRGIVEALAAQDMRVVVVARDPQRLAALQQEVNGQVETISADITDAQAAEQIMRQERPYVLILNAGAAPFMRPIQDQTWETFSVNWEVDAKAHFCGHNRPCACLLRPAVLLSLSLAGLPCKARP